MPNAGSRARADPPLPAILSVRPLRLLHLQPAARRAELLQARVVLGDVGLLQRANREAGRCEQKVAALVEHAANLFGRRRRHYVNVSGCGGHLV